MLGRLLGLLVLAVLAWALAGCGSSKSSSPASSRSTTRASPTQEEIYDRSYTECSSVSLSQLATKYHVKPNRDAIVRAVSRAWSQRFGGGVRGVQIGAAGCRDGLEQRTGAT
jgi:Flp pilus assembly protein TadD